MKKAILTVLAVGVSASLFAQGTVKFANTATSLVNTNDKAGHIGAAASTAFHVALYWGVLGSTEAQLVQIGPNGTVDSSTTGGLNPALPGRFGGAVMTTGNATAPSQAATFQVRGWTGNFTTYEAAYAAALTDTTVFVGVSGLFSSPTGGDTAGNTHPPDPAPLNLGTNFTGLSVSPVPEPSTIALGGLGAAALLLFRRRK